MLRYSTVAPALALLLAACGTQGANESNDSASVEANQAGSPADGRDGGTTPDAAGSSSPPAAPSTQQPGDRTPPERSGQVTLSAAPLRTEGGATMTLTLNNSSGGQIGYNLCTSALQTSAGRPVPVGRVCTMELRTLEPGRSADYRYTLPVNMAEDSYRFLTQVEWLQSGRRSGVRSNSFEVR